MPSIRAVDSAYSQSCPRVLLVATGLPSLSDLPAGTLTEGAEFRTVEHPRELTRDALRDWMPDLVLGALIGPAWDGLDLAVTLQQLGYEGRLCILAPALPRSDLVLREIRALCPALDIAIVPVTDTA